MTQATLRLGVLGLSEGNGHPYSWSAICNGYDARAMAACPFPVIPQYLAKRRFPEECIPNVQVTHIWTQDKAISNHVAQASRIEHVVDRHTDMIGAVDGILLARDDAENHYALSRPFLEAGLPVYIDKPIATSKQALDKLYAAQRREGQIFSCSSLRYAPELATRESIEADTGPIRYVAAYTPKKWSTYAIHIIDPVLRLLSLHTESFTAAPTVTSDRVSCTVLWESSVMTSFTALGSVASPIFLQIFGDMGQRTITFADSFSAFKNALIQFVTGIRENRTVIPYQEHSNAVAILEQGMING